MGSSPGFSQPETVGPDSASAASGGGGVSDHIDGADHLSQLADGGDNCDREKYHKNSVDDYGSKALGSTNKPSIGGKGIQKTKHVGQVGTAGGGGGIKNGG